MSERVIGLKIEINGFTGVVSNLEQLDKLIKEAKQDLLQLEIGGKLFEELSAQIKVAETQFNKLLEATRGGSLEKTLEGYGKLAGGVTSAFAAATAAVNLFGSDSEEVTQAAAKAQNLLTIALSLRTIGEIKAGAAIVANTIATKANTLATNALDATTKRFYLTLAANPYTAILTVIGLLTTAVIAFSNETSEAQKQQEEFNKAVTEDVTKSLAQYKALTAIVNDQTQSLKSRKQALDELKKLFPGYFKDLKDEAILNGELKVEIENVTEAIVNRALATQLETKLGEVLKENIEERVDLAQRELKLLEQEDIVRQQIAKAEEDFNKGLINELQFTNRIAGASALQNQVASERVGIKQKIDKLNAEDERKTKAISFAIQQTQKLTKDLFITEGNITDEKDKQTILDIKALELAKKRRDELEKLLERLKIEFKPFSEAVLIDVLQERIKEIEDEYSKLGEFIVTENEKIANGVLSIFQGATTQLDETQQKILESGDIYYKIFTDTFIKLKEDAQGLTAFLEGGLTKIKEQIDEINKSDVLSPEQKQELLQFFNSIVTQSTTFSNLLTQLNNQQKELNLGSVILQNQAGAFTILNKLVQEYDTLLEEAKKTGLSEAEVRQQVIDKVKKSLIDLGVVVENIDRVKIFGELTPDSPEYQKAEKALVDYEKLIQDVIDALVSGIITTGDFGQIVGNTAIQIKELIDKQSDLTKKTQAYRDELKKIITSGDLERFKQLLGDLGATDIQFLDTIVKNFDKFKESLGDEALTKAIEQSLTIGLENLKTADLADAIKYDEFVKEFKKKLEEIQPELAKVFEELFDKIDLTVTIKKTLSKVEFALQQFGKLIGGIAAAVRDSYSFQLQLLESDYQKTLNTVVGDTEQANQKRIELEKQYQENKKRLEKEAQVRSLQFTLAQTIASGAQAVVSTLANPLLDPISKGIIIGIDSIITAAQVGLISQQLSFAQTLRRGGMLNKFGAGGITNGPSHENGGIRFQNGGFELEGNEAVINRMSTLNYSGLLSQINQSGGGRPILVSSAMDSRLIEVLAKERDTPIRAYVVEQDITNAQQINRKLEQLASF